MKHIIILTFVCFIHFSGLGQHYQQSQPCHQNVNSPIGNSSPTALNHIISATFTYGVPKWGTALCTGTMINRNTTDGNIGFYFLTAGHCISQPQNTNMVYDFKFNYQSPDSYSITNTTNQGIQIGQSGTIDSTGVIITNGYEYYHKSKIRIVAHIRTLIYWDFALIEMVTPLPPHFNIAYAGWNPSRFYDGFSIPPNLPPFVVGDFKCIHHPQADMKKISRTEVINPAENTISGNCYTVTSIIDVLFGWIWGHSASTQVICSYTEIPMINIPVWNSAGTEHGSSGSGLFNSQNNLIGVLGGGYSGCALPVLDYYSRLQSYYPLASVKNTLNPSHDFWIDLGGMSSRKINCYDDLTLPGSLGVSGQYFSANHYQPGNQIELKASERIETTQPILVYSGANYEFRAGKSITLNPGFKSDTGSIFRGNIGECASSKTTDIFMKTAVFSQLKETKLPKKLIFDVKKHIHKEEVISENEGILLTVFPNPNEGIFQCQIYGLYATQIAKFRLFDVTGKEVISFEREIQNGHIEDISINKAPNGIYFLEVLINNRPLTQKIVKN